MKKRVPQVQEWEVPARRMSLLRCEQLQPNAVLQPHEPEKRNPDDGRVLAAVLADWADTRADLNLKIDETAPSVYLELFRESVKPDTPLASLVFAHPNAPRVTVNNVTTESKDLRTRLRKRVSIRPPRS